MSAKPTRFYLSSINMLLSGKRGQNFEDFFCDICKSIWQEDFELYKASGSLGDSKCDGYRISQRRVFQCYAPKTPNSQKTDEKIENNFYGALREFGSRMERWVFVHNDNAGLGPTSNALLAKLRKDQPEIEIVSFTPQDVCNLIQENDVEKSLVLLLNNPDVGAQINDLAEGFSIHDEKFPSEEKVEAVPIRNRAEIDELLDEFAEQDRDIRRRIMGYSKWFNGETREFIFGKVEAAGHDKSSIVVNAEFLHARGILELTENYCLAKDLVVCQQAADSLELEIYEAAGI